MAALNTPPEETAAFLIVAQALKRAEDELFAAEVDLHNFHSQEGVVKGRVEAAKRQLADARYAFQKFGRQSPS